MLGWCRWSLQKRIFFSAAVLFFFGIKYSPWASEEAGAKKGLCALSAFLLETAVTQHPNFAQELSELPADVPSRCKNLAQNPDPQMSCTIAYACFADDSAQDTEAPPQELYYQITYPSSATTELTKIFHITPPTQLEEAAEQAAQQSKPHRKKRRRHYKRLPIPPPNSASFTYQSLLIPIQGAAEIPKNSMSRYERVQVWVAPDAQGKLVPANSDTPGAKRVDSDYNRGPFTHHATLEQIRASIDRYFLNLAHERVLALLRKWRNRYTEEQILQIAHERVYSGQGRVLLLSAYLPTDDDVSKGNTHQIHIPYSFSQGIKNATGLDSWEVRHDPARPKHPKITFMPGEVNVSFDFPQTWTPASNPDFSKKKYRLKMDIHSAEGPNLKVFASSESIRRFDAIIDALGEKLPDGVALTLIDNPAHAITEPANFWMDCLIRDHCQSVEVLRMKNFIRHLQAGMMMDLWEPPFDEMPMQEFLEMSKTGNTQGLQIAYEKMEYEAALADSIGQGLLEASIEAGMGMIGGPAATVFLGPLLRSGSQVVHYLRQGVPLEKAVFYGSVSLFLGHLSKLRVVKTLEKAVSNQTSEWLEARLLTQFKRSLSKLPQWSDEKILDAVKTISLFAGAKAEMLTYNLIYTFAQTMPQDLATSKLPDNERKFIERYSLQLALGMCVKSPIAFRKFQTALRESRLTPGQSLEVVQALRQFEIWKWGPTNFVWRGGLRATRFETRSTQEEELMSEARETTGKRRKIKAVVQ